MDAEVEVGGLLASHGSRLVLWGLMLRGVALVYAISFASLSLTVMALAGRKGLNPLRPYLQQYTRVFYPSVARRRGGVGRLVGVCRRFMARPTLFWLSAGDTALQWAPRLGFVLALAALVGGWSWTTSSLVFGAMWVLYVSLDTPVGLAYPWDSLLLSIGSLAVFMPPLQQLPVAAAWASSAAGGVGVGVSRGMGLVALPDPQLCFLVRWLLARLLLGFGKLKFMGTSNRHHCYIRGFLVSQPMPTKLGWLAHHLPLGAHKFALVRARCVDSVVAAARSRVTRARPRLPCTHRHPCS